MRRSTVRMRAAAMRLTISSHGTADTAIRAAPWVNNTVAKVTQAKVTQAGRNMGCRSTVRRLTAGRNTANMAHRNTAPDRMITAHMGMGHTARTQ